MKKILVISDNDLLNQLYLINLQTYIGASVVVIEDINQAQVSFKDFKNYDLIISLAMLSEHDIGVMCFDYIKLMNLKIPLILIGTPRKEMANIIVIQSSYNLQTLLRSVASELGITAKKMLEVEVPKYFPVSVSYLKYLEKTPCELYLQVKVSKDQYEYVLCSKKDSLVSSFVTKLHSEGVANLFVKSSDRLNMVNGISVFLSEAIRNAGMEGALAAKSEAISSGFEFVAAQIANNEEVIQELVGIAETCAKVMDVVLCEVTGIQALIQLLMRNQQGYIYTHSMLVAYVAKHIIKNVTWGGDSHIERINFMVFFHDIYLVPIFVKYPEAISEEELLFGNLLDDEEKEVLLNHARLAGEQVAKYKKCPSGIDLLIKQHHGMSNGMGFAIDFTDNVSPLSKVFIIAESFVEYYLREKKKDAKFKINLKVCTELLYSKYPKHTYRKIIDPLATIRI
jgi:CheY-like chemotaxis protein